MSATEDLEIEKTVKVNDNLTGQRVAVNVAFIFFHSLFEVVYACGYDYLT